MKFSPLVSVFYLLLFDVFAANKEWVNEINYTEGGKDVKFCCSFFVLTVQYHVVNSQTLSIHIAIHCVYSIQQTGSNGQEYQFLLKGHEDLRQDERVMQLFGLVNSLLLSNPETLRRNLTYVAVISCLSVSQTVC